MFIPSFILYGFSHSKVDLGDTKTHCMIAKKTNFVHTWHLKVYHRSVPPEYEHYGSKKIVAIRTDPRNGTAVFLKTSLNDFD
jgi:hypothetical protein